VAIYFIIWYCIAYVRVDYQVRRYGGTVLDSISRIPSAKKIRKYFGTIPGTVQLPNTIG